MKKIVFGLMVCILLVLSVLPVNATASNCTVNMNDIYTLSINADTLDLDGMRENFASTGTLTIADNTIDTRGVIAQALLVIPNYANMAVTGYVGKGTRPLITLNCFGTDTNMVFNGRVKSESGLPVSISGSFKGNVTHSQGVLGDDAVGAVASWSTVQSYNGTMSAKLLQSTNEGSTYVEVIPSRKIKLNSLDTLVGGSGWSLAHLQSANAYGAQIELKFQKYGTNTPGGVGHVDITLIPNQGVGSGTWDTDVITSANNCIYYGNDPVDGTAFSNVVGNLTLAGVEASINAQNAMGDYTCGNWLLTRVRVEIWEAGVRSVYIDDLRIAGDLFSFEPCTVFGNFVGTI